MRIDITHAEGSLKKKLWGGLENAFLKALFP